GGGRGVGDAGGGGGRGAAWGGGRVAGAARGWHRRRGDRLALRRSIGLSDGTRADARPQAVGPLAAAARRAAPGRSDVRPVSAGAPGVPLLLRRVLSDRLPRHRRAALPASPGTAARRGARRDGADSAARWA